MNNRKENSKKKQEVQGKSDADSRHKPQQSVAGGNGGGGGVMGRGVMWGVKHDRYCDGMKQLHALPQNQW